MPIILDPRHSVLREPFRLSTTDFEALPGVLQSLIDAGDYRATLDALSEALALFPEQNMEILRVASAVYKSLPPDYLEIRFYLYQARYFDFGIREGEKVLDVGSGHLPFPFATHLSDISTTDHDYGRAGTPFRKVDGKPVFECNVERLPFPDKHFDFVYCSHVLEHVHDPQKACLELQRVGKRGFIETPTKAKDVFLHTARSSNHLWSVAVWDGKLEFSQYVDKDIEGIGTDIVLSMHCEPQSERELAIATAINLRADVLNTMVYWENDFDFNVRRVSQKVSKKQTQASPQQRTQKEMSEPIVQQMTLSSLGSAVKKNRKKCIFLHTYYDRFIENLYQRNPELCSQPYAIQLNALLGANFGDSDYYSKALENHGWETHDLIMNCSPLNESWAQENGFDLTDGHVVIDQIKRMAPDMIYCHDMHYLNPSLIRALRPYTKLLVGQIASTCSALNPKLYDIIISSVPPYVDLFRMHGVRAYFQPLGFSRDLANKFGKAAGADRAYGLTFAGTIAGSQHTDRTALLESLSGCDLKLWGTGTEHLDPSSPLRSLYQGEAWGEELFRILSESFMTVNKHGHILVPDPINVDANVEFANNMRLFEATGCGALVITDYKPNLGRYFEVGREVLTYSSSEECIQLINFFKNHPDKATEIAENGRARTLRDHTYQARMKDSSEWFIAALKEHEERGRYTHFETQNVSFGYQEIDRSQITEQHRSSWEAESIPMHQRALVRQELDTMYSGEVPGPFKILADMLEGRLCSDASVLEVGCASGYYFEILEYLLKQKIEYYGVDISRAMIELAQEFYPRGRFLQAKGHELPFEDRKFHTVISGGVLLHDPDYSRQIRETCRVADKFVVAHRTPISKIQATTVSTKIAYTVETVEFKFNESELVSLFERNNLWVVNRIESFADSANDRYEASYLLQRL